MATSSPFPEGVSMEFDKRGQSQSYYVSLLFAKEADPGGAGGAQHDHAKAATLIDVSRDPMLGVLEHNSGVVRHRFAGKNSDALCCVQLIIGPIASYELALSIQQQWKVNSRGLAGRGAEGRKIAEQHGLPCFDANFDRIYERQSPARRKK